MRPVLRPWQIQQISGLDQVLLEFSVDSTLSHPSGKGQGLATEINKEVCALPSSEREVSEVRRTQDRPGDAPEETCRSSHPETVANKPRVLPGTYSCKKWKVGAQSREVRPEVSRALHAERMETSDAHTRLGILYLKQGPTLLLYFWGRGGCDFGLFSQLQSLAPYPLISFKEEKKKAESCSSNKISQRKSF